MFRFLFYPEGKIRQSGEWGRWLELCRELSEAGVSVHRMEPAGSRQELQKQMDADGISAEASLMLASSQQELLWAEALHIAVVGYGQNDAGELWNAPVLLQGLGEADYSFFYRIYQRFHRIPWTILETQRCMVRELSLKDVDALFELYEKPHVTDYMETLYPYEEELAYQEKYISQIYYYYGYGMWLVWDKTGTRLMGRAGVEQRNAGEDTQLELGYVFAPEYWHQGYAAEVCRAILAWAGENLEFDFVEALVHPDNTASIRLLERLGFCCQGQLQRDGSRHLHYRRKLDVQS